MKHCPHCRRDKPPADFGRCSARGGKALICKSCTNARCRRNRLSQRIPIGGCLADEDDGPTLADVRRTEAAGHRRYLAAASRLAAATAAARPAGAA